MLALTAVVVAGGRGTRLGGCDKAFLEIRGEPIITRTLRTLGVLFPRTVVVTRNVERYADLGVEVTTDVYPGCGPLAGIHAGLLATRTPHAFVVACDMPFLEPEVIRFLVGRIGRDPGAAPDAIVPCWEGDVEPLHAVYAARCLPAIEGCLAAGEYSVRELLRRVRVERVPESLLARLPGAARSFVNLNTPAEIERLAADGVQPRPASG
jgi:molybdopterin-guanine dinucleotide biosynthesis protein A